MNKTELSNNLRQLIDIMYLKYSEIGISKIQYNEMVQKTLTYLLSKNNQKYHLEFIKKINELNFGLISNKYISNKFVLVDSYQVCLKNINDLAAFYHNIKYSPSLLELISLIKSNKTLSDNLKIVVDENIERIKLNGVESISSDENIYRLLTAYLEINEIKVDEISQQEIYESLKNDNSISTDLVKEYMRQLDKPILNKDQEYELGLRILKGDKEAINTLVEHNLKLVIYVAKRYVNHGLSFLDLIQEGNIGLIKAAQRFDVTKGYRFSTYAIWWIRQAVMRAIDNGSRTIRIPVHLSNKIVKINKTRKILTHKLNREPSEEELAKELDMPIDKLREIYLITQEPVSLDMKTSEEDDAELQDFIADNTNSEEEAVSSLYSEEVKNIIDTAGLTLREKEILCYRFGFYSNKAMTLSEVAKIYDLTRERVRQIEAKALRKLKSPYQMRRLSENKIPVSKRYTELKNKEETQTYLFDLPLIGRYNNEDIILCLNKLSDIELQIVKFLFGNNFDQVINYSKPNYYKAFYSIIYPKLSKMLKQENKAKMLRKKF